MVDPFGQAGRLREIIVGVGALSASAFFGYFGVRGAWLFFHGARTAPADPLAASIGIATCLWSAYVGARLLGRFHASKPLLPHFVLLLASAGAFGMAAWLIANGSDSDQSAGILIQTVVAFSAVGIGGLVLGWRRLRSNHRAKLPNATL
jgi:hypothetical protein